MTQDERIRRADRARALLKDDLLVEALAKAREHFKAASIEGATVEERETARAGFIAVERVERELDAIAADGDVARESVRRQR